MSIIRSNIARQLLAEGGAPRKPFSRGGREDVESQYGADSIGSYSYSDPSPTGFEGSPEMGGRGTTTTYGTDQGDDTPQDNFKTRSLQNQIDYELGLKNIFNLRNPFAKPELPPQFYYNKDFFDENLDQYGLSGKNLQRIGNLQKGLDIYKDTGKLSQSDFEKAFFGPGGRPPKDEGGDNEPIKKLRAPITEKIEEKPKNEFEELMKFYGAKFEDGGEVRQKYGIGDIVKKGVRAVKKVAKSPVGKIALIAGLGYLGSKTEFGGGLIKSFKALDPIKQALILGGGALTAAPFFMGEDDEEEKLPTQDQSDPAFQSYLAYYGGPTRFAADGGDIDEAPMKMASYGYNEAMSDTYDMFLQMKEKDLIPPEMKFDEFLREVVPEMSKKQGIERAEAAGGGMMNPNDEMLDLGGNEMDLRGGGFVPLGEYEKKDDVPARLSKNEFVFTADAVRAAGGGSVDRGADLMYKTMKQLENKVV